MKEKVTPKNLNEKKFKVRLLLSYDGCDYFGWQRQTKTPKTIQGTLEKALSHIFKAPITVCGAGRTDAGVHARAQQAHFWCASDPTKINLVKALNGKITPNSLVTKGAWLAPHEFHALSSATEKTYKYLILNRPLANPFRRNHITHISKPLNLDYLNSVSQPLIGTHDFKSFQTSGTEVSTTVKTITYLKWEEISPHHIQMTVTGNGFLKQMVRNIVGTQLYMARSAISPQKIEEILASKNRQAAKDTAPPQGLYLDHIKYPKKLDSLCLKI